MTDNKNEGGNKMNQKHQNDKFTEAGIDFLTQLLAVREDIEQLKQQQKASRQFFGQAVAVPIGTVGHHQNGWQQGRIA